MTCQIRKMDGNGDSTVATFDPEVAESVKVADDALAEFLADCVKQHGTEPPVWARRAGCESFDLFNPNADDLTSVEEVVVHQPLVGG